MQLQHVSPENMFLNRTDEAKLCMNPMALASPAAAQNVSEKSPTDFSPFWSGSGDVTLGSHTPLVRSQLHGVILPRDKWWDIHKAVVKSLVWVLYFFISLNAPKDRFFFSSLFGSIHAQNNPVLQIKDQWVLQVRTTLPTHWLCVVKRDGDNSSQYYLPAVTELVNISGKNCPDFCQTVK